MSGQELDFIQELDAAISNVGSDVVWERTVGGVKLLISPITVTSQEKVTEAISKMDSASSVVSESKRLILSHSVVGVEQFDLRRFRAAGAVFPVKGRDGKPVKVALDKYVYDRIGSWGSQFVDDTFTVYADLMESFQKENLKDVKFENAKAPIDELVELEARVHELREHLRMPELVEKGPRATDVPDVADTEPPVAPMAPETGASGPEPSVDFDPFRQVQEAQAARPPPRPVRAPAVDMASVTKAAAERAAAIAAEEAGFEEAARQAAPPAERTDVLDVPATRAIGIAPPVIDQVPVNKNPRFAGPRR